MSTNPDEREDGLCRTVVHCGPGEGSSTNGRLCLQGPGEPLRTLELWLPFLEAAGIFV